MDKTNKLTNPAAAAILAEESTSSKNTDHHDDEDDDDAHQQILRWSPSKRGLSQRQAFLQAYSEHSAVVSTPSTRLMGSVLNDEEVLSLYDHLFKESSWMRNLWVLLLGITAYLDFVSAMTLRHYYTMVGYEEAADNAGIDEEVSVIIDENEHFWLAKIHPILIWVRESSDELGMLFSILWFIDAFVEAHRNWVRAAREHDKQQCLLQLSASSNGDDDNNRTRSASATKDSSIQNTATLSRAVADNIGTDQKTTCRTKDSWWRSFDSVYYQTIAIQLLLLPMGFFVFGYNRIRQLNDPNVTDDDGFVVVHHFEDKDGDGIPDDTAVYTAHATLSLGYFVVKHTLITIARRTGSKFRLHAVSNVKSMVYRQIRRGIFHPVRFVRKIRRGLRVLRWIKYLAPLIGAGNKLKGNVTDLLIKYQQHLEAVRVKLVRRRLWKELSEVELKEQAAILIQKTFRAHQTRKKLRVVNMIRGHKEVLAALKLQSCFRASLARARARLKSKLQKLQELEAKKEHRISTADGALTVDERCRMYLLQEELKKEAKKLLNEKLLLRPNTRFAVTWKILFVIAVIFEISILAFKPHMARTHKIKHGEPLDIEKIMAGRLVPTPVTELKECHDKVPPKISVRNPLSSIKRIKQIVRHTEIEQPPKPWYCSDWYTTSQSFYIALFKFYIHNFLVIVGMICFLDVFITFFTGEIDKDTGNLVPKAWFTRWILPGFALQILVNPKMETVSEVVFGTIRGLSHHGPVRVARWTLALFYPAFRWLLDRTRNSWYAYATKQNEYVLDTEFQLIT